VFDSQLYTFGLNNYLIQKDMCFFKKEDKRIGKNAGENSGMLNQAGIVSIVNHLWKFCARFNSLLRLCRKVFENDRRD